MQRLLLDCRLVGGRAVCELLAAAVASLCAVLCSVLVCAVGPVAVNSLQYVAQLGPADVLIRQ
jgi:hypothetical protein